MNPYKVDPLYSHNANNPLIMQFAPGDYLPFKVMAILKGLLWVSWTLSWIN